jgi:cytochrome c peroxidase
MALLLAGIGFTLLSAGQGLTEEKALAEAERPAALVELGEALFFDSNLSLGRTQSCASCHDPSHAFADPGDNPTQGALSVGQDGASLGARNAPTVAYAYLSPSFRRMPDGDYVGGQFHDGRAPTLEAQARQPLLNPVEMAMPDEASIIARLRENEGYVRAFDRLFGPQTLDRDEAGMTALTQALVAYERSAEVSPFDSKYDRYLRGAYTMTDQEELGRVLFFSNQFTNCHLCHKLTALGDGAEPFSNYRYRNIGVPANPATAGRGAGVSPDRGLGGRSDMNDTRYDGQFKVPTLRNVAVTGPYMHNGVFKDLRTVMLFYDHFNSSSPRRQINPETGAVWGSPEVPETLAETELKFGPPLDDRRIDALIAFLKTLTDRRYEPMLDR